MVVHDCQQGSVEWLQLRLGIPTASEFGNLVTPEFKIRDGETPKTYLATKLAETWLGKPLLDLNTFSVEQGTLLEDEAWPWLKLETDWPLKRVGFITTDDGTVGCSPDGLVGNDCGLEIKCPSAHVHMKYLINGVLPKEYAPQVHGGMMVTGFSKWKFLSYRRGMPALILEIERDEAIIAKISEALYKFFEGFATTYSKLKQMENT